MLELSGPGKDFFARGIERITSREGQRPNLLPDLPTLPPTEWPARSSLAQVLEVPHFEDEMDAVLQPRIDDRHLLRPGPYARALADAGGLLEGLSARHRGAGGSHEHQILERALQVIQDERDLLDLVSRYRSALYAA